MIELDVVIRTLAEYKRKNALIRALDSIRRIQNIRTRPIVVVNGKKYDPFILKMLENDPWVKLIYSSVGSAGEAIVLGRREVTAPYFMFLDDDDEVISDNLGAVLQEVERNVLGAWDVVITNRLVWQGRGRVREYSNLGQAGRSPLAALLQENWLSAGASVFRTDVINADVLDVKRDHHEWTHIGFRLATRGYVLKFIDVATAVYSDTDASLSKSRRHSEAEVELLLALRREAGDNREGRRLVDAKYRNLLHINAARSIESGFCGKAWLNHLRSLKPPHTFKYLLYSRRLVGGCFSRLWSKPKLV